MEDATDRAVAESFIYGEEPTKMDRLVFDTISECKISSEQFPNVYRWRHTIALYSPAERNKWAPAPTADESNSSCASWSASTPRASRHCSSSRSCSYSCSTPNKDCREETNRPVTLQVSNWLRVTGPNSPRSTLSAKNINQNVSFGFLN